MVFLRDVGRSYLRYLAVAAMLLPFAVVHAFTVAWAPGWLRWALLAGGLLTAALVLRDTRRPKVATVTDVHEIRRLLAAPTIAEARLAWEQHERESEECAKLAALVPEDGEPAKCYTIPIASATAKRMPGPGYLIHPDAADAICDGRSTWDEEVERGTAIRIETPTQSEDGDRDG